MSEKNPKGADCFETCTGLEFDVRTKVILPMRMPASSSNGIGSVMIIVVKYVKLLFYFIISFLYKYIEFLTRLLFWPFRFNDLGIIFVIKFTGQKQ